MKHAVLVQKHAHTHGNIYVSNFDKIKLFFLKINVEVITLHIHTRIMDNQDVCESKILQISFPFGANINSVSQSMLWDCSLSID